jgi:nitrogen fixation protein FixH
MAGLALGVVALTGVFRALDEVGWPRDWARLVDTSYGITVLVKVGLFLPLIALAARNRYRNVPAVVREGCVTALARTATAELGIAALIFAATGVLSELPPAATVAQAKGTPTTAQHLVLSGHDFATTTRVRLTVSPGTVGPNRFVARVTDFDTGRPVPATSVTLGFSLPSQSNLGQQTLALRRSGSEWTGQGTTISIFGTWAVEVTVQEATTSTTIPLRLTPNLPTEQIQQTTASGQPTLYTIALSGGDSLQTYIQPGRPGKDTVHFTFFMANGNELPITSATGMAVPPGRAVASLPLIRFDKGHFVANTTLTPGRWRFVIQATPATGAAITAYFDQLIR